MLSLSISPALSDSLLNNAVSAVLLTSLAMLVLQALPHSLPRLRAHVVIGVFAALLALPALRYALPQDTGNVLTLRPASDLQSAERFAAQPELWFAADNFLQDDTVTVPAEAQATSSLPSTPSIPPQPPRVAPEIDWLAVGALVWVAGMTISFARLLVAWLRLGRLSRALPPIADPALRELWRTISHGRTDCVKLVTSPPGSGLFAFGCLKPCVAVPADLISRTSETEALALLTHEWAHIQNRDVVLGQLQRIVASVYWWLPTVHWMNRRLSLCRETLADTAAAASVESPALYANSLLNLAAQACRKQQLALGVLGIAGSRSALAQRLTTLSNHYEDMKSTLHNPHPFRAPLAVLGLCSLCLTFELTFAQDPASDSAVPGENASSAENALPPSSPVPSTDGAPPDAPASNTPFLSRVPRNGANPEAEDVLQNLLQDPNEVEKTQADMHRALAELRRELVKTQQELEKLKIELAKTRAEKDAYSQKIDYAARAEKDKIQADEAALELKHQADLINKQRKEMQLQLDKARAEVDAAVRASQGAWKGALRSPEGAEAWPVPSADAAAFRDQQRALQETIMQAVKEALRAATDEIRKEFQRNFPESPAPKSQN